MAGTDRRESIRLAIGAALLPFLGARPLLASTETGRTPPGISPPPGLMIYRRKLERSLAGGRESVIVTRDFEVSFTRQADGGFLVYGKQRAASVDAPPQLAALAELETRRVESGLFPMELDPAGQITGWPAPAASNEEIAAALATVSDRFSEGGMEVGVLIEALHGASANLVSTLPDDLFAPAEPVREESRTIELPWGDEGEVHTRFEAERDPETRLMRTARRLVTTRYGGEERQNCENWELFRA